MADRPGATKLYLEIPDTLAERLFVLARTNGRSLNDEAIALLEESAQVDRRAVIGGKD